jgi:hypothetical protein
MTSKIARFASDFAQNLSISSKINSISPKSLDLVAVRPQNRWLFFVWPLQTLTNDAKKIFKYINGDARKNTNKH